MQKFFKVFRPVFLFLYLCPIFLHGMTNNEFVNWWEKYRDENAVPYELEMMEDYFVYSNLISYSSNYWNALNKTNIEQITNYGYENFKQTVTKNYFAWVVSLDNPYAANLVKKVPELMVTLPPKELYKIHSFFGQEDSIKFNTITMYFLNYMLMVGARPYLEKLEEPLVGNPPYVTYNKRRISQDILNSLLEFMPISKNCSLDKVSTIIEIGAGSGRTAYCFLSLMPNVKYIIADIPPALYVCQKYFLDIFPERKIMQFRPFSNFDEIANEFEKADIVFLTPDQLQMLPDHCSDLFLAVDCLHEMKPEMIDHYFNEAERLSSFLYFKCWQKTLVPYDAVYYSSESYPVHATWKLLFKEPCVVPSDFFHAFYQMSFK